MKENKIFYRIDGTNINIYQVVEWSEFTDHLEIYLSNNTVFGIYRDSDRVGYDTFLCALKDRTEV